VPRSILVAVDASPSALSALEEAVELARGEGARLVLISVAAPSRWTFVGPPYAPYPTPQDLEREARDVVDRAEALVPPDVPVSSVVRAGPPSAAIVARAVEGRHDLVVVGSRGRGGVASFLFGSVSRAVCERCPVPVLVAGSGGRPGADGPVHTLRPSPPSERPAAGIAMHADPASGGLVVFLWLVAVLLVELHVVLWLADRMYAP
jgi:nucleotide-binding universal stress UspA family protein